MGQIKKTELFLEAFENSMGDFGAACKQVGITRTQIIQKAKSDPEFMRKLWEIKESLVDLAISTQLKFGLTGDATMLNKYLEAHGKHRGYGRTEEAQQKDAFSDIIDKEKEVNPKEIFQKQLKLTTTEDIKKALKNIKNIKV